MAILFYAATNDRTIRKNNAIIKLSYLFSFFIIVLFNGLRYYVGKDYVGYLDYFNERVLLEIEPSFKLINEVFRDFEYGFYYLIFICTFATYFFFYRSFISKKVTYIGLSIFLLQFMCLFNNILRQAIAVSIFYYSLTFIQERKPLKFVFLIIVASSFHYSSVLLLPIYFLKERNVRFAKYIVFIIFVGVIVTIPSLISMLIREVFDSIPIYGRYLLGVEGHSRTSSGIGVLLKIALGIQVLYLSARLDNKKYSLYRNLLFFGICFTIIGSQISIISRFTNFFYISVVYLASALFKQKFEYRTMHLVIVFIISIALFEAEFLHNENFTIPYKSILGKVGT